MNPSDRTEAVLQSLLLAGWVQRFALTERGWSVEWTEAGAAATLWRWSFIAFDLDQPGNADRLLELLENGGTWPAEWSDNQVAELRGFLERSFLDLGQYFDREGWNTFLEVCVRYARVGSSGI